MARPGTPSWPQSIPTIPFGSADAPEGEHLYREADAAQRSAASAMRQVHTSLQSCVKISLTAGGAQRTVETGRMAAPQEPCPLPGGARLTGIESRDDAPRRTAMRHGRGTRSGQMSQGCMYPRPASLHLMRRYAHESPERLAEHTCQPYPVFRITGFTPESGA